MPRLHFLPFYTASLVLVALLLAGARHSHGVVPSAAASLADTLRLEWRPRRVPPLLPSLLLPPQQGWAAFWARGLEESIETQRDVLLTSTLRLAGADTVPAGAPLHPVRDSLFRGTADPRLGVAGGAEVAGGLAAMMAEHTGLEIRIQGRTALGGAWNRMHPCTGFSTLQCERPLVPHIAPDMQLAAVVRGMLFDRVHVAVDYDAAREFDASNNINIHYQGETDELLRRFEVGDVSLALPASRFLTRGIPAGNWGVRAIGQAGPLEVQALWAQQSGAVATREFRQQAGIEGLVQQASAAWDDVGYAAGQFFFLFDPAEIRGHPHLDVRALTGSEAPARLLPQGAVQLFRYEGGPPRQDGSTLILRAVPHEPERAQEAVTGPFRLLQAGIDYQLHPSGTWVMLNSPLREDEALGVAYVTLTGESVGQLAGGEGSAPREIRLLKGVRATHQPASATWPLEMRHIYRISGSDEVDAGSVRLVISRGEQSGGDLGRTHPLTGQPLTYLQLFGLDEDAPAGELDAARLFRPREEEPGTSLRGTYLIFPTLRPFAEPPPLPGARLSAAQAAQLLGSDANPGIYAAPDERARRAAARFRLSFSFTQRSQGVRSVFSLGAIGLREGSERIYLGGRILERGVDYEIQYEIGEIQLLNPNLLFGGSTDTEIRATFEQKPLFGVAPTSVAGFSARYPLGTRGELNFVGLSQQERAFERRPTLGAEPTSLMLGGMSGRVAFGVPWLDRVLNNGTEPSPPNPLSENRERGDSILPRLGAGVTAEPAVLPSPGVGGGAGRGGAVQLGERGAINGRSLIQLSGELALSLPDPARQSYAYLEDFEERDEISIPLARQAWRLGSAPASTLHADGVLPARLDAVSSGTLVWQHDYLDSTGRVAGSLRGGEIDTRIRVAGNNIESGVLYLSLEGAAPGPGWRSLTSVLSPTG
ncbi:MAG TPA: hypothetical protein VGR27_05655, partial [Longimicrobiaceae bacterium]|nr:hypothetical protein [Longimicrobiaceae bacterium]